VIDTAAMSDVGYIGSDEYDQDYHDEYSGGFSDEYDDEYDDEYNDEYNDEYGDAYIDLFGDEDISYNIDDTAGITPKLSSEYKGNNMEYMSADRFKDGLDDELRAGRRGKR